MYQKNSNKYNSVYAFILFQFSIGFHYHHSTVDQVHRVTMYIECALEEKKYRSLVFLDAYQTFNRVLSIRCPK